MHWQRSTVALRVDHIQPNHLDGVRGLQALRADLGAVHDGAAAKQPIGVVQIVQAGVGGCVAAVKDEAVGLYQPRWTDEFVWVPPERWALAAAAGTQNALVGAIEFLAFGG